MKQRMIKRLLKVPERSFFLFGPRGTGKSTWLKEALHGAHYIDLLDTSLSLELSREPGRLGALAGSGARGSWVVIDEIQKNPSLLDEVHRLIEEKGLRFALSGSSARRLRRGGVNLLGGRALTRELAPFTWKELGNSYDTEFSLQWGSLPLIHADKENAADILGSYVATYLKEEIREEGIVRNLSPFIRFLGIAGQLNGQTLNSLNIAREAAVPRSTVDVYFSILSDTLLGYFLPPYRPGAKVREQAHQKFYWCDPGIARGAAGLLSEPADRLWKGCALETLLYHELRVYNHTQQKNRDIFFYRSGQESEIDFVIETRKRQPGSLPRVVCIEVKLSKRWERKWERPMRSLASTGRVAVDRMIGIYRGERSYHFDGLDVHPYEEFLARLYRGEVF
ncbi:MAG: DUF4143 domain-containing protein [Candidatus Eremiobacteraeota bacterium]|nr:DUF4143 domain-containing protein [Candidatus Eremiobacteraeota bacterium]